MIDTRHYALSQSIEHYTPRYIWERAIKCMGGIDLDPAADPGHNIPAKAHYTKKENGLTKQWNGRIWLNPPFGQGIELWFGRLTFDYCSGNVTEAIVLWKAATETGIFRNLTKITSLIAFPHSRIDFLRGSDDGITGHGSTFSPALFYIGSRPDRFIKAYSDIADIWQPVRLSTQEKDRNQTRITARADIGESP